MAHCCRPSTRTALLLLLLQNHRTCTILIKNNAQFHKLLLSDSRRMTSTRASSLASSQTSRKKTKPLISSTMKAFMRLVHPDLFEQAPAQKIVNQQSLQTLLAIFAEIKSTSAEQPYPPRQHHVLTFYIRRTTQVDAIRLKALDVAAGKPLSKQVKQRHGKFTIPGDVWSAWSIQASGDYHYIMVVLSTNGGDCRRMVEKSMSVLFALSGLDSEFEWDSSYWQLKSGRRRITREEEEDEYNKMYRDEYQ